MEGRGLLSPLSLEVVCRCVPVCVGGGGGCHNCRGQRDSRQVRAGKGGDGLCQPSLAQGWAVGGRSSQRVPQLPINVQPEQGWR